MIWRAHFPKNCNPWNQENLMNKKSLLLNTHARRRRGISLLSLTMATALGVFGAAGSSAANAQATAGSIFGKAPAGETVMAKSTTNGMQRHVKVDSKGRYMLRALPIGIYNVVLEKNGQPAVKHPNVPVVVGRGSNVDFECVQDKCAGE
ncbi:MAG: carboxypeptidase-like regulatory domain-containing protein [Rhodanobacter sp.]